MPNQFVDPIFRREIILSWLKDRHERNGAPPDLHRILAYSCLPEESKLQQEALTRVVKHYMPPDVVPTFSREARYSTYRRLGKNLTHWRSPGFAYFITFGLNKRQEKLLAQRKVASVVEEAILFLEQKGCLVDAYVIMPDHVHLLLIEGSEFSALKGVERLKRYSAAKINQLLGRKGRLWQGESFDHIVRHNGFWARFMDYIHLNPVKAQLVACAQDYRFSSAYRFYRLGRN